MEQKQKKHWLPLHQSSSPALTLHSPSNKTARKPHWFSYRKTLCFLARILFSLPLPGGKISFDLGYDYYVSACQCTQYNMLLFWCVIPETRAEQWQEAELVSILNIFRPFELWSKHHVSLRFSNSLQNPFTATVFLRSCLLLTGGWRTLLSCSDLMGPDELLCYFPPIRRRVKLPFRSFCHIPVLLV